MGYCFHTDASLENLKEVRSFIDRTGHHLGVDQSILSDLRLAVDEAVTNVVLHGYKGKSGTIEIEMMAKGDGLVITIKDRAAVFDSDHVQAPKLDTELAERPFGGMGIFLIDKMTDEHEYRARPGGGNELVLIKRGAFNRS